MENSTDPPQPNLMDETGRTNPVYVEEWVYPYGTRLDPVGTDPKSKLGHPGDRSYGGCM